MYLNRNIFPDIHCNFIFAIFTCAIYKSFCLIFKYVKHFPIALVKLESSWSDNSAFNTWAFRRYFLDTNDNKDVLLTLPSWEEPITDFQICGHQRHEPSHPTLQVCAGPLEGFWGCWQRRTLGEPWLSRCCRYQIWSRTLGT